MKWIEIDLDMKYNMTKEKVNLTWPPWHTYTDHLKELLHHMRTDNTFADVTLVSDDGREVRAHKVVLAACSPIIKELFTKKGHKYY